MTWPSPNPFLWTFLSFIPLVQADNNDTDNPPPPSNSNTAACLATMQRVLTWAEQELLSLLKPAAKKRGHGAGKRLMNPMDATLLAADPSSSSSASLLQQTIADHTATAATLSQSLFDTTLGAGLGGGGGVKRGAAGGALDMGIKVIQVRIRDLEESFGEVCEGLFSLNMDTGFIGLVQIYITVRGQVQGNILSLF